MTDASNCVRADLPLDIAAVDRVRTALMSAMADALVVGSRLVVLDLTNCDFVDVVGYRMLSELAGTAEVSGVALQVVGAPAPVIRVITLLDGLLAGDVGPRVAMDVGTKAADPPLVASSSPRQRR